MIRLSNLLSLFPIIVHFVNTKSVEIKLPEIKEDSAVDSHLNYAHIKLMCLNRDKICRNDGTNLCAVRFVDKNKQYKDFENACYLFYNNMCENPGKEFAIVTSGSCEQYNNSRRNTLRNGPVADAKNGTSTAKTTMSTLYSIVTAFDQHVCPLSCPDIYNPVCVNVNRRLGKYAKLLHFVNHCAGDVYYCKHQEEFSPAPQNDEKVETSLLSWSYCGSIRYLQLARFSEMTSSMGHYGWLSGNYKYSHIMEPHERMKGYG
ncbi:unnamed protein product [Parnassius mnemosyne]|uniref:Uncharacterized protein n=1 Tax=Parnassius mnemosyne TaxID=213953 RepID=A0AAV1LAY3_9NEOP